MATSSSKDSTAYASAPRNRAIKDIDVVVVGAGLSGLQAATDVQQAGFSCVVLEAKDRVGGKTLSTTVENGPGVLDLGAAWINDRTQYKMYAYFKKFGCEPIIQRMEGYEVFRTSAKDPSFKTTWPGLPPVGKEQQAMFDKIADDMDADCESVNILDSTANNHVEDISLGEYFRQKGANGFALEFWTAWIHDLTGTDPDDIGLVYWLDFVKSAGGIESLLSDGPNGAQYMTNRHGNQTVSKCLAENLNPRSVYLNSPVNGITQTSNGAVIETLAGDAFRARKVLISVPTPLYRHIKFIPPLPADKQEYVDSVHLGPYCKCILIYSSPWWREAGLNGSCIDLSGPVVFSRDVSSDADGMYAISCLIGGRYAQEWSRLPVSRRVKAVQNQLATMIGSEHGGKIYDTIQTIEKAWAKEPFIEGVPCPMPAPGGIWPRLGNALRRPFRNLYFIGTETAIEWKGYMEGAVRAGERGAAEVIADLQAADQGKLSSTL
ncbi:putative amine oxidase [Exophiala viscosa]|uniref:Amine oxidase n=1 Tax=Exophiala viscosa TaxID=2486360 RepID=A0AAN6DZ28_9EURO|nr:putative amine oxidase [Exophiala viscosa]